MAFILQISNSVSKRLWFVSDAPCSCLNALLPQNETSGQKEKVTKKDVHGCLSVLDRELYRQQPSPKKWLQLWGKLQQKWPKLNEFLQFSNYKDSCTKFKATGSHLLFYHFMWGLRDFNNELIRMENQAEKLCRLSSHCLSIFSFSNHLCPRSSSQTCLGSVIWLFGSKDPVITGLLLPFLPLYLSRAQYRDDSGTRIIKGKSI